MVENLSARYSPDGPAVLHNLSFHVRSGERIGIGEMFPDNLLRDSSDDMVYCSWTHRKWEGTAMLLLVVAKTDHVTELAHALSAALYPYRRDGVL